MVQQSDVFKDRFYIFSANVRSFKHQVLSFQVGYKTNVSLESLFILSLLFICSLLLLHEDIKSNPVPRKNKNHLPTFCHWNLNSLPVHNFSQMLLLKAYNTINTILYICLKLILTPRYRQTMFH